LQPGPSELPPSLNPVIGGGNSRGKSHVKLTVIKRPLKTLTQNPAEAWKLGRFRQAAQVREGKWMVGDDVVADNASTSPH
jgi:hypothetical protein